MVRRNRPQPGVELTHLKQGAEPDGDAGDKYTGLDRFGRVAGQRRLKPGTGETDWFQYGYDRDSNRPPGIISTRQPRRALLDSYNITIVECLRASGRSSPRRRR
jgi:hypothetical protein